MQILAIKHTFVSNGKQLYDSRLQSDYSISEQKDTISIVEKI
jgi:hypothetical protein